MHWHQSLKYLEGGNLRKSILSSSSSSSSSNVIIFIGVAFFFLITLLRWNPSVSHTKPHSNNFMFDDIDIIRILIYIISSWCKMMIIFNEWAKLARAAAMSSWYLFSLSLTNPTPLSVHSALHSVHCLHFVQDNEMHPLNCLLHTLKAHYTQI